MNNNKNFIYQFAIFLFSFVGIFLTFHMHFLSSSQQECNLGSCLTIFDSISPLGISNIYWGMLYYITLTLLSLLAAILKNEFKNKIILIRNYLIIFGFIYSIFLVLYQILNIGLCELCLISSLICTLLFTLVILLGIKNTTNIKTYKHSNTLYASLSFVMIFAIVFNSINYKSTDSYELDLTMIQKQIESAPIYNIPISGSVVLGNPKAKITVLEFTDFQ